MNPLKTRLAVGGQKGMSILEVVLASAMFVIFAAAAVTALLQNYSANRLGAEFTIANQFASEGIEAVRSIKNQDFSKLNSPQGGVIQSSNVWAFSGANNTFASGKTYTRTLSVASPLRDCSTKDIVESGSQTYSDPDTKKVTSTVDWEFNPGSPGSRSESVSLSTYLTDWKKPITSGGPIMIAYSKTTSTPFFRTWDGLNWSSERSAQNVGGNINYIVLKSARSRDEAILGTLDANGNIYAQVWDGVCWGTPTLMANVGATNATTRSFDIAYEKHNDRAMFLYLPNSTSVDPAYRIWDGSAWSSATTITAPPTTGLIKSIDMTQNPISSSNEIAMIMLDVNRDVYGMAWDGNNWGNMGVASVWDATASIATKKTVDLAYEQNSGRVMFIWGDATATDQYYRIWNGSTLTAATLLDIPAQGGIVHWMELVSRPNSDELLYGTVDAGSDLNTRKWSGSAWDTATQHPEHSAGVENISSMVFDIVWETHPSNLGKAWLLMGNSNVVQAKQWSGTAWGAATNLAGSDDTSFIRLKADPLSGAVFTGIYQNVSSAAGARDITERRLTGGGSTWSAKNVLWGGPTTAEPVHFKIDIAVP